MVFGSYGFRRRTIATRHTAVVTRLRVLLNKTRYRRRSGKTICTAPMPVRRLVYRFAANQVIMDRKIAAGPQSAHLWWPAVAKLQAASVPIA